MVSVTGEFNYHDQTYKLRCGAVNREAGFCLLLVLRNKYLMLWCLSLAMWWNMQCCISQACVLTQVNGTPLTIAEMAVHLFGAHAHACKHTLDNMNQGSAVWCTAGREIKKRDDIWCHCQEVINRLCAPGLSVCFSINDNDLKQECDCTATPRPHTSLLHASMLHCMLTLTHRA